MAVIAAASDTAVDELAIVLEIDGENRLATLYAADFADPAYHIGPLFFCRQQVQRGVVADGHIMEVPRKPDALLDEQVQEFVRRDGVDVFPGITDGRPKNDAVLAQEVHGVYDLVEIVFAAAAVIDFTESFDTEGEAEIATSVTSSQKASSMSVPLVKAWNSQSGCFRHRRRISFLRMSGSPPVSR